jgi:hypothetical protein
MGVAMSEKVTPIGGGHRVERYRVPMDILALMENGRTVVDEIRASLAASGLDTSALSDLDLSIVVGWVRSNIGEESSAAALIGIMVVAAPGHPAFDEAMERYLAGQREGVGAALATVTGGGSAARMGDPTRPMWQPRRGGRRKGGR